MHPAPNTQHPTPRKVTSENRTWPRRPQWLTRTMRPPIALAAMALGIAALVPLPSGATFPGMNGRITFMKADEAGLFQVWVANADLSSQVKLTAGPELNTEPVWAPGGSRIAFTRERTNPDSTVVADVFTMKPDGSKVRRLTDFKGITAQSAYSPDGRLIAFISDQGNYPAEQGIYVALAADGSSLQRVTKLPANASVDLAPRFSPDGTQLVFTRYRTRNDAEQSALFVVNADGSGLRRLTSFRVGGRGAGDADWSPDGTRLVFETIGDPGTNASGIIYVVNVDGSGLTNLTRNRKGTNDQTFLDSYDPVWSPDGSKILFSDAIITGGFPPSECKTDLATINPDGSARAFVSPDFCSPDALFQEEEHQADWESIP